MSLDGLNKERHQVIAAPRRLFDATQKLAHAPAIATGPQLAQALTLPLPYPRVDPQQPLEGNSSVTYWFTPTTTRRPASSALCMR